MYYKHFEPVTHVWVCRNKYINKIIIIIKANFSANHRWKWPSGSLSQSDYLKRTLNMPSWLIETDTHCFLVGAQVGDPGPDGASAEAPAGGGHALLWEPLPGGADGAVDLHHAAHRNVRPGHEWCHQRDWGHQRILHLHLPRYSKQKNITLCVCVCVFDWVHIIQAKLCIFCIYVYSIIFTYA